MRKPQSNNQLAPRPRVGRLTAAVIAACVLSVPASATVNIASSPLLTQTAVSPNVLFVLDDSGSMHWEIMPDSELRGNYYMFPRPSGLYGAGDYSERVPNFFDDNFENWYLRSATNNTVFYNPELDYEPWQDHNGTSNVSMGNMNPANALYNPAIPALGGINLTQRQDASTTLHSGTTETTSHAQWQSTSGSGGSDTTDPNCRGTKVCEFEPVTFFVYKGSGSRTTRSNYVRYRILNGNTMERRDMAGTAVTTNSDPVATPFVWNSGARTIAGELQNFANWFSYYRSRLLTARAGASIAFAGLDGQYRVGFTTINRPGQATYTYDIPTSGGFAGSNRDGWFDKLLTVPSPPAGTPLRSALKWAGDYYSQSGSNSVWLPADEAQCRRSYTILTTDGYWNGGSPSVGNSDGSSGPTHTDHREETFGATLGYSASAPFQDGYSNTLADVAMEYWKRDLQTGIDNKVAPRAGIDPAFWQHMNTFTLSIGKQGTLTVTDPISPTFSSWPSPTSGSADHKIDDLWHAAVNGRGKFVAAQDPKEFADGLREALGSITEVAASASSLSGNSTSVVTGSAVYQARYVSGDWSGDLVEWKLNATSGEVISTLDATTGEARTTGWKASEHTPAHGSRVIYTRVGGVTTEFSNSGSGVTSAVGAGAASGVSAADLVNYVRGDAGREGAAASQFRQRFRPSTNPGGAPLGDIVNSSPAYVGSPADRVYDRTTLTGAAGYQGFRSTHSNRTPIVYVGANDGMLHAFDAATGAEVFAYIPSALLGKLAELAKQDYGHEFYVDGEVIVEDVYDGSNWRSILVASLGRGGKMLFALDVTDPANLGASSVLWEAAGDASNKLGFVLGSPIIAPLNNGEWGVIVGNGYNSDSDTAHLVILNAVTGSLIKVLNTDSATSNGLSGAGGWDDDGDGDVDFLYAGDVKGRLWKFDVSAASASSWTTSNAGGSGFEPVFNATDAVSAPQAITAPPTMGVHPENGELWIFFGTGKFISHADRADKSVQTWYGIRDAITAEVSAASNRNRSQLAERVIKVEGPLVIGGTTVGIHRLISDVGEAAGGEDMVDSNGNVKKGWYIDLIVSGAAAAGERMLSRNTLLTNVLLGETLIPKTGACEDLGDGWLMAVNPWTGGRPEKDFFDVNGDGKIDASDRDPANNEVVSGWKAGNGGIPYLQRCGDALCVTTSSTDADVAPETVRANDGSVRGRLSWRELLRD